MESNTITDEQLIEKCKKVLDDLIGVIKPEPMEPIHELVSRFRTLSGHGKDAIAFGDWLKTFPPLEKENDQWVLESQISTEELYSAFRRDNPTAQPAPVSVEEIVEAVRNKFHMIWTYQDFDSYLPMIKDAVKQILNNSKTANHDERG